ncbi:MAG TPA: hypothetical protein VNK95_23080, partial [Caldilineaceae bacterium]|nr:hypothetical protein [Caldilineaceae bacterium]
QPDSAWEAFVAWAGAVNERRFQATPSPELPGGWIQEEGDLRARIALARFDLHTADAEWERLAAHEGLPPAQRAAYHLRRIWPHLALAPDPEQAAFRLEQARTLPLTLDQQVELARLAAWQTALTGDREDARRQSDELRRRPDLASMSHRLQVAAALEAAAHHEGDVAVVADLVDALAQAAPASYRLRLLDELWRCPPLSTPYPALVDRWLALLPGLDEPGLDPALAVLRLAEVYRVCRRRDEALRLLDLARLASRTPLRLALRYRLYQAYDRLGWEPSSLAETRLEEQEDPSWRANSTLAGLMALDHAERVLSALGDRAWAAQLWQTAHGLLSAALPAWRKRLDQVELALQAPPTHERRAAEAAPEGEEGSAIIVEDDYVLIGGVRLRRRQESRLEATGAARPQLRLTLTQPAERQWHVAATLPGGESHTQVIALGTDLPDFTSARREVVHRGFVQALLEDPHGLADRFSARLVGPEAAALLAASTPETAPDILWHAPSRDLAWLPWELLLRLPEPPEGRPLPLAGRAFYRLATPPATPFHALEPERAVDALIVEPPSGGEVYAQMTQRNIGESAGVDLKRIYEVAGARMMPLSDADDRLLGDMLEKLQPRVVHLVAEVREQGRRVALDLGSQRLVKSAGPAGLAATGLAGALGRCATPPLVILQIPSVPSDHEQVRQLCLRNAFAQELIELAPRISLLGIGLGDGQSQLEQAEMLVAGFAEGQPVEALARRMWETSVQSQTLDAPRLDRLLAFLGAALFTHDPTQQFGWAKR